MCVVQPDFVLREVVDASKCDARWKDPPGLSPLLCPPRRVDQAAWIEKEVAHQEARTFPKARQERSRIVGGGPDQPLPDVALFGVC